MEFSTLHCNTLNFDKGVRDSAVQTLILGSSKPAGKVFLKEGEAGRLFVAIPSWADVICVDEGFLLTPFQAFEGFWAASLSWR